jgi:hypothetical protein
VALATPVISTRNEAIIASPPISYYHATTSCQQEGELRMTQQGPTIKSWQFRKLRGLLSVALFALVCALAGAGLTAEPTQKPFVIEHYALRNGRDWDVYAARVTAPGKVLDANGFVVAAGQHNQCRPDVGFAAGFYLVVWQEFVGDGTPNTPGNAYVVRGKRISSNGKPADDRPIEIARIEKESHALNPVLACQESTALVGFTVRAFSRQPWLPGRKVSFWQSGQNAGVLTTSKW